MNGERVARLEAALKASPRVRAMPRSAAGLPIPVIVARDREDQPIFAVNHSEAVAMVAASGSCGICGQRMEEEDVWLVGGPRAAFDPRGAFLDPPMHRECATFALRVCVYLATPSYREAKPGAIAAAKRKALEMGFATREAEGSPKPDHFVLMRIDGMVGLRRDHEPPLFIPNRMPREWELWRDGEPFRFVRDRSPSKPTWVKAAQVAGVEALAQDGLTINDTSLMHRASWAGKLCGVWPWTIGFITEGTANGPVSA